MRSNSLIDALGPVADPELGALAPSRAASALRAGVVQRRFRRIDAEAGRLGHSSSAASSSVPGPVPRSRMRLGPAVPAKCSTAAAINVSLSGRGTSAPGPTSRSIVQKARWPVM